MTLTKLLIYIAIFATALLVVSLVRGKSKQPVVNWIQFFVGGLFIFSGAVKAIDPVGTAIKMEEYFEIFVKFAPAFKALWHFLAHSALQVSIIFIVLEIVLGFTLLIGKYIQTTVWMLVGIIFFFTFLTGFSHFTGEVTDCGCFGDFMKLTPWVSFKKDILLTVLILILLVGRKRIASHFKRDNNSGRWTVLAFTALCIWFTLSNYYDLPVKDFRAYKIDTFVPKCIESVPDKIKSTYTYKNNATGEEKEFVNVFPKPYDAWTYVSTVDVIVEEGKEAKCTDFNVRNDEGVDIVNSLFQTDSVVMMITSANLSKASREGFERLTKLAIEASEGDNEIMVVGITGSSLTEAKSLRHDLGLPINFYTMDEVPIKTMNRSNPGLVVMVKGKIDGKWHHRKVSTLSKMGVVTKIIEISN